MNEKQQNITIIIPEGVADSRTLVVTGERGEESPARAKYMRVRAGS